MIEALALHAEEDSAERTDEMAFRLTSSAFADGTAIPADYTCDGADLQLPLEWADPPAGTVEFALIMDDPDAHGFVHWVVIGIPASSTSLGASWPASVREGRTDFGRPGYGGPCPPSGTHRYVTTLYALAAPLGLSGTVSAAEVRRVAQGLTLATAVLTGTYRRAR